MTARTNHAARNSFGMTAADLAALRKMCSYKGTIPGFEPLTVRQYLDQHPEVKRVYRHTPKGGDLVTVYYAPDQIITYQTKHIDSAICRL